MSSEYSGGSALLHIFYMHQLETAAVFLQQLHRVMARMHDPKHVHLVTNEFRFCLGHHKVKKRAFLIRQEFVAMRVIEEFESVFCESFTSPIEDGRCLTAGFFIKWILVRNPSATDVFETQHLCVSCHFFDTVAALFKGKVTAHSFQASGIKFLPEFLRS